LVGAVVGGCEGVLVTDSGISTLAREALAEHVGEVVVAPLGAEMRGTS